MAYNSPNRLYGSFSFVPVHEPPFSEANDLKHTQNSNILISCVTFCFVHVSFEGVLSRTPSAQQFDLSIRRLPWQRQHHAIRFRQSLQQSDYWTPRIIDRRNNLIVMQSRFPETWTGFTATWAKMVTSKTASLVRKSPWIYWRVGSRPGIFIYPF